MNDNHVCPECGCECYGAVEEVEHQAEAVASLTAQLEELRETGEAMETQAVKAANSRADALADQLADTEGALLDLLKANKVERAKVAALVETATKVVERPGSYDSGGSQWWADHDALAAALAALGAPEPKETK